MLVSLFEKGCELIQTFSSRVLHIVWCLCPQLYEILLTWQNEADSWGNLAWKSWPRALVIGNTVQHHSKRTKQLHTLDFLHFCATVCQNCCAKWHQKLAMEWWAVVTFLTILPLIIISEKHWKPNYHPNYVPSKISFIALISADIA